MGMSIDHHIYTGVTLESPVIEQLNCATVAIFLQQAPYKQDNSEEINQDAAAVIPVGEKAVVLVVADGMGGAPSGDIAARLAIESLVKNLEQASEDTLRDAILDGIEKANKAILQLENGAATTLAIVEINGNRMRSYHVGDSGIIVTGQRGRIRLQTTAHSPTAYAVEAGYIDEKEALAHDERNIVSNIVGSRELRIEIGPPVRLAPRDTVVVASDGLFDNLLTEEIVEQVRCGALEKSAATLASTCVERMKGNTAGYVRGHADDLSFIIYRPGKCRN
jgi:serine/threonine protein phosphatase PrpC